MKRRIAIVAGGYSSEHDVSLKSAAGIESFMDHDKYDVEIVRLEKGDVHALEMLRDYDFVYITIHGTPGENGLLQGYLDMVGVPYSCCGVLPAALTFNKYCCNHYLENFGYRIAASILLRIEDWRKMPQAEHEAVAKRVEEQVGLPCFIKSNVGGSSNGCTKVKTVDAIIPAIELAFAEGEEVVCEAFMKGTEVTCGMYKTKQKTVVFPLTEVVPKNEFFDFAAKYYGESDEITPARIPDQVRDKIQAMTSRLYDILGCSGIIRVDYILTTDEDKYSIHDADHVLINLLEVNTTPGMTPASFVPQQVRAAGLDIKDVLSDIIENKF